MFLDLDYDRYKFVVNCVIAEQRGAGFRYSLVKNLSLWKK